MKKLKFKNITSFLNDFSFRLRSCSCLLGPDLAVWCLFDVVYILCLLLASSVAVVIYINLNFVYCVSWCCFRLLSSSKEMELQNVPDVLGVMGKEKAKSQRM